MKRNFLWTIWDTVEKDYAVDNRLQLQIFKDKEPCERLCHCWNWNQEGRFKPKKILINK